jgi:antirestriction factor ArdC-like protein
MTTRKHTRRAPASAQAHRDEAHERNEQLRQSLKDAAAALMDEVRAGKSARLEALLTFEARFHQYSANNVWLIALQCPHAERVAGYRAWEQMGYHVAKGQKAIRILAPRVGKRSVEAGEGVSLDDALRTPLYFTYVPVFDVSQVDPAELAARPLPSFYHDLGSDAETVRLMAAMETALRASGVRVTDVDPKTLVGDMQGWSRG